MAQAKETEVKPFNGPVTAELAKKLNEVFGSTVSDDTPLNVLKHWKDDGFPFTSWSDSLLSLNTRQRAMIGTCLSYLINGTKGEANVGVIRSMTTAELSRVSANGSFLGQLRAEFLKEVFKRRQNG